MGNGIATTLNEWQCEDYDNLAIGLRKCQIDRIFSFCSFIIFWILFYQIYFVYHINYNVPVIQLGKKQKLRARECRMDILVMCAISAFYTTLHYLASPRYRSKMFPLLTIMKFNIMILITYYYLKMASEQIFQRVQYLRFKWVLIGTYLTFMLIMVISMFTIYNDISSNKIGSNQLCISWHYMSLRWGELISSIIFLIITVFIQIRVEEDYQRRLLKVNFEQIIFQDRFSSANIQVPKFNDRATSNSSKEMNFTNATSSNEQKGSIDNSGKDQFINNSDSNSMTLNMPNKQSNGFNIINQSLKDSTFDLTNSQTNSNASSSKGSSNPYLQLEGTTKDRERDTKMTIDHLSSTQSIMDPSMVQSMQEKVMGQDVDPYGGEYLQFKNAQYKQQKSMICKLFIINGILLSQALFIIICDLIQYFNYDNESLCLVSIFQLEHSFFAVYWIISRSFQNFTGPIIALIMFWRARVKKMSKLDILAKKRELMEEQWELESDDDASVSRVSYLMDDRSMRESSFRGTTKMKNVNQGQAYDNQSDFYSSMKDDSKNSKQRKLNLLMNTLNDAEGDMSNGLASRKRSRGSTTDDKKSNKSSVKLKYDSKNYTAQKEKVIEARKAKFGIFKKSGRNNKRETSQKQDEMFSNQFEDQSNIDSRLSQANPYGIGRDSNVDSFRQHFNQDAGFNPDETVDSEVFDRTIDYTSNR